MSERSEDGAIVDREILGDKLNMSDKICDERKSVDGSHEDVDVDILRADGYSTPLTPSVPRESRAEDYCETAEEMKDDLAPENRYRDPDVEDSEDAASGRCSPRKPMKDATRPTELSGNLSAISKTEEGIGTPISNRLPSLTPRKAQIGEIPANDFKKDSEGPAGQRTRLPPKLMRMTTVAMSTSNVRPVRREPSVYYEEPRRAGKPLTWDEATNSRPPLRIDMEGPTPWSYSPRNKPLNETNAPSWTFGAKCFPEKSGGGRTAWAKSWFQSPNAWSTKVDFHNDRSWPTPNVYNNGPSLGSRQATIPAAPSYSMGFKRSYNVDKQEKTKYPGPIDYRRETADSLVMKRSASFTHGQRRGGTILWSSGEMTPGPGKYDTNNTTQPNFPGFTIRGLRREISHILGPFSTF